MRIGTWNLQGRWDVRHLAVIEAMDCDVLLLTEVSERLSLPAYGVHLGAQMMAPQRRWAAVASRPPMQPQPDPHGASAMVEIQGLRVCSSVLPWRSCGAETPWLGDTTAAKTATTVAAVEAREPSVWGGDWNHALTGREWAGSMEGRRTLLAALDRLELSVPTASLPHQIDGLLSIDHIAVPESWQVTAMERHRAFVEEAHISDHDAYVVASFPVQSSDEGREGRSLGGAEDCPD